MTRSDEDYRIIIAGGGTGGHLFPGIAVAMELEKRCGGPDILFVVGRRKMESEILSRYGYAVESIDIEGLKGRGWKKGMGVLLGMPRSLSQSFRIIKWFSPNVVLGVGGYSSGPLCLVARLMRIPTAIHEQNSYPGLTNRLLSRVADRVFVSFAESIRYLKRATPVVTGNPVREHLVVSAGQRPSESKEFTILVVGGSQGAMAINQAFGEALEILNQKGKTPRVIHQTGKNDYSRVVEDYRVKGLRGEVTPFINDMAEAYQRADVVISRAGASTIFELAAVGKASILIPYPHATNRHQEINARSLVRAGGAEMILEKDLSGEVLANALIRYMEDQGLLKDMGQRATSVARKDAAKTIVDHLIEMMGGNKTLTPQVI